MADLQQNIATVKREAAFSDIDDQTATTFLNQRDASGQRALNAQHSQQQGQLSLAPRRHSYLPTQEISQNL
jgi:hypothetical protein